MSLWQQIQETIINTAYSSKALAVDGIETFHHHRALSLNKKGDTIRKADSQLKGRDAERSEAVVDYYKHQAKIAATARQEMTAQRKNDANRFNPENQMRGMYDAVTSDLEILKEAGGVLWGYIKTADNLARATVNDTKEEINTALNSTEGQLFLQSAEKTLENLAAPLQQVWQQSGDSLRALDLNHKTQEMLDYFQDLGRD